MPEKVQVKSYFKQARLAKKFSKRALEELAIYKDSHDEERIRQASEKCWGAFIQIIEAIAKKKTISHNDVRNTYYLIQRKKNDKELKELYELASDLHRTFYGGHDDFNIVEDQIRKCEKDIVVLILRYDLEGKQK